MKILMCAHWGNSLVENVVILSLSGYSCLLVNSTSIQTKIHTLFFQPNKFAQSKAKSYGYSNTISI